MCIDKKKEDKGGAIDLERDYWGLGSSLQLNFKFKTQIGFDIGNQNDLRKRYNNQNLS